MSFHYCPFCHSPITLNSLTVKYVPVWIDIRKNINGLMPMNGKQIRITIIECPECHRYEILAESSTNYLQTNPIALLLIFIPRLQMENKLSLYSCIFTDLEAIIHTPYLYIFPVCRSIRTILPAVSKLNS